MKKGRINKNIKTSITGILENEIKPMVKKDLNKYRKKKESKYKKSRTYEEELEEVIRRAFYKSPVTDPDAGIVGVTPMNLPIGKYFTFKGNKPKYE